MSDLTKAIELMESGLPADYQWVIAKGKTYPDEPLYGFRIYAPFTIDGELDRPLAESEHDDPTLAVEVGLAMLAAREGEQP